MTDPIDIPVTHKEFLEDAIADQEALLLVIDGASDFFAAAGFDLSGVADIARTKAAEAQAALDRLSAALTLHEAVDQLSAYSSDEVAELMRLAGARGARNDSGWCPTCLYLAKVLDSDDVGVSVDYAWQGANRHLLLPQGVRAFNARFDCGEFPELIDAALELSDEEV